MDFAEIPNCRSDANLSEELYFELFSTNLRNFFHAKFHLEIGDHCVF